MEICRACLSTEKDMIAMDSSFVNNFNLLTNLNIKLLNKIPLYICSACFDTVKFCMEFRKKCIASNLTLMKNFLSNSESKHENINANDMFKTKQEVKLEYPPDIDNFCDDSDFDDISTIIKTGGEELLPATRIKNETGKSEPKNIKAPAKRKYKARSVPKKIKAPYKRKDKCDATLLPCGVCSKSFMNTGSLVEHFEQHKFHKSCELCTETFMDFTHLLAHRIVHLPERKKKCHLCLKRFIRADYLEFHYIKEHNLKGEGGQYVCKQCLVPVKNPRALSKHVWSIHSGFRYKCNDCGKGFTIKNSLRSHINGHHNKNSYKCDICNFTCNHSSGLKQHKIRKHVMGKMHCNSCNRLFTSQERLDKHVCKNLHGVLCPICGVRVQGLARHLRSHSSEQPFRCDRCPAKFKTKANYTAHMNKHEGNRTFRCEYCPMSFYSQPVLVKHRRTHTGEKPYVCKICSKGFTGNYNLKVHMKIHGFDVIVKKSIQIVDT